MRFYQLSSNATDCDGRGVKLSRGLRTAAARGDGVLRRIQFLQSMRAGILSNHRNIPPFGLDGGQSGKPGMNKVIRAEGRVEILPGCAETELFEGDQFQIETPGGGGSG